MSGERIVLALGEVDDAALLATLDAARALGFHRFVGPTPSARDGEQWYAASSDQFRPSAGEPSADRARVTVRSPEELAAISRRLRGGARIAVRFEGEWILPLEQLVATATEPDQLWFETDTLASIPSGLGALERGAGSIVVAVRTPEEVHRLHGLLDHPAAPVSWDNATVVRVEPAGLGDRVIVDTTSLLDAEEGLLVGSSAKLLFHVRSEAVGSRYTRPRPFRVNAGAAHSYTLCARGETRYLTELLAGEPVFTAKARGTGRIVRVGRLKIERRPMVLVEAELAGTTGTLFLQEAETVRVSGETGAIAVTELARGDQIACAQMAPARHLGQVVREQMEER